MTVAGWGAWLGLLVALGLLLIASRVAAIRRPQLAIRVLPYLHDLPGFDRPAGVAATSAYSPLPAATGVFGPPLRTLAGWVDRIMGGAGSVRRRLDRAGVEITVADFRVQQVLWGLVGFGVAAGYALLNTLAGGGGVVWSLILCAVGFSVGVIGRDYHLSGQVRERERRIVREFPTVAELLALAVAAGEGPVAALDRVVRRSGGELSRDLARVLADIRTGEPVGEAFDRWAAASSQPIVGRFAQGLAVAVERGTPLADVLHAQAADVREAGRRELIEVAARKEVLMLVPVVFLVLPVTVFFAFWPGVVGLSLTTP
jgi:tight adherence protein C